jgi:hypothetical protein
MSLIAQSAQVALPAQGLMGSVYATMNVTQLHDKAQV